LNIGNAPEQFCSRQKERDSRERSEVGRIGYVHAVGREISVNDTKESRDNYWHSAL
jgi:hypothetical protein